MSASDKYDFWIDRKVDGFTYRFNSTGIQRAEAATPHSFRPWKGYRTSNLLITAWRELCDQAAEYEKKRVLFEAFKRGALDRKNGVVVGDNPFDETDSCFWMWMNGWLEGVTPKKETTNAAV